MSPKFLVNVILCAQPPNFMTSFARKQYPNAMIWLVPDTYCNAPIWLVWDIYPNAAIRWVWDPNPNVAIWLQHTTLHTINEFFFSIKKRWLKKLLSAYEANVKFKEKRKNIYWPIYLTQSNNYTCLKLKLKLKLQHILKSPSCTFH